MSVDHLPARTTRTTIAVQLDEAPDVIDHSKVVKHYDRKQAAMYATGGAAALVGVAAALTLGLTAHPTVGYVVAVVAAVLVAAAMWLRFEVAAEGRRWVYATTPDTL
jgi:hypothetical protein